MGAGDISYIWTTEGWLYLAIVSALAPDLANQTAETAIFQHINGFYNPRRRHSYLGGSARSHSKPKWHSETGDRHKTGTRAIAASGELFKLRQALGQPLGNFMEAK